MSTETIISKDTDNIGGGSSNERLRVVFSRMKELQPSVEQFNSACKRLGEAWREVGVPMKVTDN